MHLQTWIKWDVEYDELCWIGLMVSIVHALIVERNFS